MYPRVRVHVLCTSRAVSSYIVTNLQLSRVVFFTCSVVGRIKVRLIKYFKR